MANERLDMSQYFFQRSSAYRLVIFWIIYCKSSEGCEEDWYMFGEKCYLFSSIQHAWEDAKEHCETLGASLVKIEDEREDSYVRKILSESNLRYAWIGARYNHTYGEYRWLDGSEMTYNGWAPGRPGTDEGCVDYLQKFGYRWNAHCDCVYTRCPFICEKGCQSGWNMFGNKCYLFSKTNRGWQDAQAYCELDNGNLVIVEEEEEHEFIRQKVSGISMLSMWIGARFYPRTGEHRWLDGNSMTVSGWGPGRPGITKGCVEYFNRYDYLWNSRWDCVNRKSPYICEKRCEVGWEKYGNKCYLLSHVYRGWEDAKSYCETIGASLVKVESESEHQYIRQIISAAQLVYVWIGARYDPDHDEHRWSDGSPLTLDGWAPGLPGNFTGCVDYLRKFDYTWNSHCDCERTKGPFICQKPLNVLYGSSASTEIDTGTSIRPEQTDDGGLKEPLVTDGGDIILMDKKSSSVLTTLRSYSNGVLDERLLPKLTLSTQGKEIQMHTLPTISAVTSDTEPPDLGVHKTTARWTTILPTSVRAPIPDTGTTQRAVTEDIDDVKEVDQDRTTRHVQEVTSDTDITSDGRTTDEPEDVKDRSTLQTEGPKISDVTLPRLDEQDSTDGSISRVEVDEDTLYYICRPDDSIDVYNLPANSYYFAIQTNTTGTDVLCTVSRLNDTAVKIAGCSKDLPVLLSYGSYADMVVKRIYGGKSLTTVSILCNEIPDSGVSHVINNSLSAELTIDSEDDISPTYRVVSSLNATETNVGDPVAWTISFPVEYVLEVSNCTAEPATVDRADLRVSLVSKGGCNLNSELITDFTDNSDGTVVATLTSFMFYNDKTVLLECEVTICPDVDTNTCDTTCSRQKRDIHKRTYGDTRRTYTANVRSRLHVTDPRSNVSKLGSTLSLMAVVQIAVSWYYCL